MRNTKEIIQKLKIYGADIDGTMKRMLNDEDFYIECIIMFLQDKNFEKLKQSLDCGDLSTAFEAAHTLKGVSANLGLSPIYNLVCSIVEPLRSKKDINYQALYEGLISSKNKLKLIFE